MILWVAFALTFRYILNPDRFPIAEQVGCGTRSLLVMKPGCAGGRGFVPRPGQ